MTANIPNPVSTESSRTSANFQIKSAKVYVPVITISINNNIKFLENLKEGFERPISWNEYKTKKQHNLKTTVSIISLIQHLTILIYCLLFHLKLVK